MTTTEEVIRLARSAGFLARQRRSYTLERITRLIELVKAEENEAIIAQKDAEILEQCRINGMGAEREAALLGKVAQQSAALKLAREALFDMQDSYAAVHGWKDSFVIAATTAIAAIDALGEVK